MGESDDCIFPDFSNLQWSDLYTKCYGAFVVFVIIFLAYYFILGKGVCPCCKKSESQKTVDLQAQDEKQKED
eukprot:CAMPEP_0115041778 /NCGR_PEP_ID=MMETSP0216-20121206/45824_1 /TAXON_ID=223996 /ORGANISM="Protocruzia adherens, Strain Boccale" /LENGTH=71 /DNA_ID=CAMNT_0002423669 /DNA_START=45 /DNA_END=260 /DNA_ORIENTATION=-